MNGNLTETAQTARNVRAAAGAVLILAFIGLVTGLIMMVWAAPSGPEIAATSVIVGFAAIVVTGIMHCVMCDEAAGKGKS